MKSQLTEHNTKKTPSHSRQMGAGLSLANNRSILVLIPSSGYYFSYYVALWKKNVLGRARAGGTALVAPSFNSGTILP
jgi:hypothetical protein